MIAKKKSIPLSAQDKRQNRDNRYNPQKARLE
jgi:hypothetical protein